MNEQNFTNVTFVQIFAVIKTYPLTLFEAVVADLPTPFIFAILLKEGEFVCCQTSQLLILWSPLLDRRDLKCSDQRFYLYEFLKLRS